MLFLLFWSAAFCVAGIGGGSLASWDEAYYAIVSRGIFRSGDWINLTYFDTPFYDKPPLYFWVTTVFYRLFGVNEFATRLCSALAGIGVVLVTYFIGKRLLGRAAALAGAGILLSSSDFLHYARWGTLDITHLFFFSLAILFYLKSVERPVFWFVFWLSATGAVMTKGPLIVLAIPLIVLDSCLRKDLSFIKKAPFWGGLAVFFLAALPWHIAAYHAHPDLFTRNFLYKHLIERTTGAVEGHTGNWYFYIRTLINKYHPWIFLAPAALPWALWRARVDEKKRAYRFLIFWVVLVLGFFTFAVQTKLQWYTLLMYPALSLLLGAFSSQVIFRGGHEWAHKAATAAVLILHIFFSGVITQDYSPALKELSGFVKASVPPGRTVFLYEYHDEPAAKFYFDRPIRYADSLFELDAAMKESDRFFLMVPEDKFVRLSVVFAEKGLRKIAGTQAHKTDLVFLART